MKVRIMTIAELRRNELEKLTSDYTNDPEISKNLMCRFYRVSNALRLLSILENDDKTANENRTLKLSETTHKRVECLKANFEKYGLTLVFYSYLPTLTDKEGNNEKIHTFFY